MCSSDLATFLNGQSVAATPVVSVTGSGCIFANFQIWGGFSTGNAGMITWQDSGNRNYYTNVHFAGQSDAASAGGTASRSLVLSSGGEHVFQSCTIGVDTVQRTTGVTRTLEFKSGTARNSFIGCVFPVDLAAASAASPTIYTAAAAAADRWQRFEGCTFINSIGSGATAQTALVTLAASTGGVVVLKSCTTVGTTDLFADATTAGQMYIDGGAPTAATTALAVNPA